MEEWHIIRGSVPSKSNSYKIITLAGHGSLCKTAALKAYENTFYMQIGSLRNININTYFEFYVRVFNDSMRKDLDNAMKIILDCLQHTKTISNDNQCVKIVAEKFIDKCNPRIEFRIIPITH